MSLPVNETQPAAQPEPAADWMHFARHLATESARVIRPYFRADYQVEFKEDNSPVTIADRRAEEVMRTLIAQEFPDHGVLGEEFGHDNPGAAYQWVLDPIDGTKSFVSGSLLFGTLIALLHNGRPLLGVIHHPILDDFLAGDGAQTRLNDRPVRVRSCPRLDAAFVLATSHRNVHKYQNGPAFDGFLQRVKRYRTWGDCHGYFLVATGGADVMLDPILNAWDLMALIPIIEGAGGRITDWRGGPVIGGSGAIATAGSIHDEVVRRLNPARDQ